MTLEEQRIELAKLDGWTFYHNDGAADYYHPPSDECDESSVVAYYDLPDYLNDLNAARELTKKMMREGLWYKLCDEVHSVMKDFSGGAFMNATAAQWCEAILKVKGLWK